MDTSFPLRRVVAATTIGSLSVAALLGIAALLGASELGEGEGRILATTLAVGLTSTAVLCCLAVVDTRWAGVGGLGGLLAALALLLALSLIWVDGAADGDGTWQAFGVAVVLAATLAQSCLLLAIGEPDEPVPFLTAATLVAAGLLAGFLSLVILGPEGGDGWWRIVGVVAILDVLGTLVSMALGAVRRASGAPASRAAAGPGRPVTLPPALAGHLEQHARATGRSYEAVLADAVSDYLAAQAQSGT